MRLSLTFLPALLAGSNLLSAACGTSAPAPCGLAQTTRLPTSGHIVFACDIDPLGAYTYRDLFVLSPQGSPALRLTRDEGVNAEPAWSPNGDRVAFSSTRSGALNIFAAARTGSPVARLTFATSREFEPAWSPDGRTIAFASGRAGARGPLGPRALPASIYVLDAGSHGQVRRLTYSSSYDGDPAYSPDGSKILFVSDRSGDSDIYSMNADGSHQTRLTHSGQLDDRPSWSPDGTRIAFGRGKGDGGDLSVYVMAPNGRDQHQLVPGLGREPTWSPDGRWLAFVSDRDGHSNIFVARADGTDLRQITHDWAPKYRPAWGP